MSVKTVKQSCNMVGVGKITLQLSSSEAMELTRISDVVMRTVVNSSAATLVARIRANAPKLSGDLRRGIIVSPAPERSKNSGKIVYDIYFDASMNDNFVKITKEGKRYYYPASQEYGFRIANGRRVPGRYYMRDASVDFAAEHRDRVADGLDAVLEEL